MGGFSKKLFELFLLSEKPAPFYGQQSKHYNWNVPSKTILRPKRVEPFFPYPLAFVPSRIDEGATPSQSVPSYPLGNQITLCPSFQRNYFFNRFSISLMALSRSLHSYFQIIIKYCYIFAILVDYSGYFYYLCQPKDRMINYGTKRYIF